MFDFSPAVLVGSLLFSLIGMVAFRYGQMKERWATMGIGIALMVYPYVVSGTWLIYGVGVALVAGLFVFRG